MYFYHIDKLDLLGQTFKFSFIIACHIKVVTTGK